MKEYDIAEIGKNFELTVEPIKLNPFTAFDAVDVMASKVEAAEFRKAYDTDKMSIDDFNAFNFAIYAIIVDFPLERASS